MVIRVVSGNLLDSDAQTLVNTVNCVGAMGKGIALEFKKRFPALYADYAAKCRAGQVVLGRPYLYKPLFPPYSPLRGTGDPRHASWTLKPDSIG